tara:strand:- start:2397 stop:2555 length:159 start_codon:yes stop_codon:yes gene_type:complete
MKDNYITLESLLLRAVDMYQYNLEQYSDENPTMVGAIEEILYEIKNEEFGDL